MEPQNICIVTEFMPRGSIYDLLHDVSTPIPRILRLHMAQHAARGIYYLHLSRIVHLDLKSMNLLVDSGWNVKVADFGLAKIRDKGRTVTQSGAVGTAAWTAPEVIRLEKYSYAADVYSFAVVLWELLTREDPYGEMHPMRVTIEVATHGLRPESPNASYGSEWDQYARLMRSCWREEPEMRPHFEEILSQLEDITNNCVAEDYHTPTPGVTAANLVPLRYGLSDSQPSQSSGSVIDERYPLLAQSANTINSHE